MMATHILPGSVCSCDVSRTDVVRRKNEYREKNLLCAELHCVAYQALLRSAPPRSIPVKRGTEVLSPVRAEPGRASPGD